MYINSLGYTEVQLKKYQKLLMGMQGLILITGPTGSGKTTTLYATLNNLNNENSNIISIEDPVEYSIQGINQIQINPKVGLNFSNGLKSILRQDPNIIMVGEIRDLDTAEFTVRAALTGHKIFSTLHTNNAVTAIVRLIDIGLEPYLVASTLKGVVAQRLVKKLCNNCKEKVSEHQIPVNLRSRFKIAYQAIGCSLCNFTGYNGRRAIFEVLEIDNYLQELILQKVSIGTLVSYAQRRGMVTLEEQGISLVEDGIISLKEFSDYISDVYEQ